MATRHNVKRLQYTSFEHRPGSELLTDSSRTVCKKVVYRHAPPPADGRRELSILRGIHTRSVSADDASRHVVKLLDYDEQESDSIALYFDYIGPDILSFLRSTSADGSTASSHTAMAVGLLMDLAAALVHIHALDVMHRDINPTNVLIDTRSPSGKPRAVLIDFGIAWSPWAAGSEPADGLCPQIGTGIYRAPETLFGCSTYDASIDVWAFGMTALTCLRPSFRPAVDYQSDAYSSELALMSAIFKVFGTPARDVLEQWANRPLGMGFKHFDRLPDDELLPATALDARLRDTLLRCLSYRSRDRPTANDLLAAFSS